MTDRRRWLITSGICRCGHSWRDHHLGVIINKQYWDKLHAEYPEHPPYVPQECEHYGSNEMGGLDREGNPHCGQYIDAAQEHKA